MEASRKNNELKPTPGNYQLSRLNATRHGILSRDTVLPWESQAEYEELLGALNQQHEPQGPTEELLVEELAGIFWANDACGGLRTRPVEINIAGYSPWTAGELWRRGS